MTLANTSAKLLAVLAISLSLATGGWAQANPEQKPATRAMKPRSPRPANAPATAPHKRPAMAAKAAAKTEAAAKPAGGEAEALAADKIEAVGKRDPFAAL